MGPLLATKASEAARSGQKLPKTKNVACVQPKVAESGQNKGRSDPKLGKVGQLEAVNCYQSQLDQSKASKWPKAAINAHKRPKVAKVGKRNGQK